MEWVRQVPMGTSPSTGDLPCKALSGEQNEAFGQTAKKTSQVPNP